MNEGIEPELCSLHYLRLDEVVERIVQCGKGTKLAKMDIESAYCMVLVHPQDRALLAIHWAGQVFFNTTAAFSIAERLLEVADWRLLLRLKPTLKPSAMPLRI